MSQEILLYSTNTLLAYRINQQYYRGRHYVWCTPFFDHDGSVAPEFATPPTSTPKDIYENFRAEVERGDRHGPLIQQNRLGILRGASIKEESGIIDGAEKEEIQQIVAASGIQDFHPLLYVIPSVLVDDLIKIPAPSSRAHPLARELIIDALPRSSFDVITLERRGR